MQGKFNKEDKRALKTEKILMETMSRLLEYQKFVQITVKSFCNEAQVSRTTFYAHFPDKYALLKRWLTHVEMDVKNIIESHEAFETGIDNFTNLNSVVIKNLIEGADNGTVVLLCDYLLSLLDTYTDKTSKQQMNPKYDVLSNFFCGGIMNYLNWQVDNDFPEDPAMNSYLYEILMTMLKWYSE